MDTSSLFNLGFEHWQAFLLSFIPAMITLAAMIYFWNFPAKKINRIFLQYLVSTFAWQVNECLGRLSRTEDTARIWDRAMEPVYIIQFTSWLHCVLLLSGKMYAKKRWFIYMLYTTTFSIGIAFSAGIFTQHFSYSPFWGWTKTFDSIHNLPLLWVLLQICLTLYLLAAFAIKNRFCPQLKFISRFIFFGYAIPVIAACVAEVVLPLFLQLSPIPIAATLMIAVVIVLSQLIAYKVFNFSETMDAERIAEIIQETVFVISAERHVTYINPYGTSLAGSGTIVKKLSDLFPGSQNTSEVFERQVISPAFEKAQAARFRFSMELDGREIHWDTTTYPIFNRKRVDGLLVMCRDISYQVLMAEYKLTALRSQMNPHFIFNSLNTIQHFIHANQRETAESFLSTFSRLIRKILDNSANSFIPLVNELQTIELYLKLEKARFGNYLNYTINVDESLDTDNTLIPSMLVQPYIENAILHGISPKVAGGVVSISIRREKDFIICRVTDNGVGRKRAAEIKSRKATVDRSYGMSITKDRLDLLSQQMNIPVAVTIDDMYDKKNKPCGTTIEIWMPLQDRF
ncbi:MAG: histidine kinase [Bacteroidota bacterium]